MLDRGRGPLDSLGDAPGEEVRAEGVRSVRMEGPGTRMRMGARVVGVALAFAFACSGCGPNETPGALQSITPEHANANASATPTTRAPILMLCRTGPVRHV